MPFFSILEHEDKVPQALSKFNTGIEKPFIELLHTLMRSSSSPFSIAHRELIAAFVSGINSCDFCFGAHTAAAIEFGVDEDILVNLLNDIDTANIDEELKPIFKYIKKLTISPSTVTGSDAQTVFDAGWSERALYDAIIICCSFSFMNRFTEGLGLSVIPEQFSMQGKMLKKGGYKKMLDLFE